MRHLVNDEIGEFGQLRDVRGHVVVGYLEECCAEPLALAERVDADELLTGVVLSDAPWLARVGKVRTFMGGRGLSGGSAVEYIPARYGAIPSLFASGALPVDIAYVQASPGLSLGIHVGYVPEVLAVGRRCVVEVNEEMPTLRGAPVIEHADEVVHSRRPLLELPSRPPTAGDRAIAEHVVRLIPSGSTVEVGLGSLTDAVLSLLAGHRRDLRLRSGMLGDAAVDLADSGALADEEIVATTLMGTRRLYSWAASEPRLRMAPATEVHSVAVLSSVAGFVALNSALEVDLTGQAGAEELAGRRVSGVGGQADFAAGATLAPGGRSIIAVPSSRIVDGLSGPVSTPRLDVGFVVTEHGVAELAGRSLEERETALRAVGPR